ncbi:MAG TPA: CTP synthetase, partial [Vicinamibacteria bacterium]
CQLAPGSRAEKIYGASLIHERHRHRYEFNKEYEGCLSQAGLAITGKTPDGKFVEIAEVPGHPWYVAVQFHPEFKSKPLSPHPLFADFVRASLERQAARRGGQQAPAREPVAL